METVVAAIITTKIIVLNKTVKQTSVLNIMSENTSGHLGRPPPSYSITVRQQPLSARACGFSERDRRVVDPPPILVLGINDPGASPEEVRAKLRSSLYTVYCSLWDPYRDEDESMMPEPARKPPRRLIGTPVGSQFYGKDNTDREQCFFHFSDLSVRTPGTYCLKFNLVVLDSRGMEARSSLPVVATAKSNPFKVYNAKDFQGMRSSTNLTKCLRAQGCVIPVKKGSAKADASYPQDEAVDDLFDDEGSDEDDIDGMKRSRDRIAHSS